MWSDNPSGGQAWSWSQWIGRLNNLHHPMSEKYYFKLFILWIFETSNPTWPDFSISTSSALNWMLGVRIVPHSIVIMWLKRYSNGCMTLFNLIWGMQIGAWGGVHKMFYHQNALFTLVHIFSWCICWFLPLPSARLPKNSFSCYAPHFTSPFQGYIAFFHKKLTTVTSHFLPGCSP